MVKRARPRFLTMVFSLLSVLVLILSACGGTPTASSTPAAGNQPVKGGAWIDDLYEEPHSFIPNGVSESFAPVANQSIWAQLFYSDSLAMVHPRLLTAITIVYN